MALALTLLTSAANAGVVADLSPGAVMVSVGDPVGLQFTATVTGSPVTGFAWTYALPATARYIPGSLTADGVPLSDGDPRVAITTDSVRVALDALPVGTTTLGLKIRAVGSIGLPIPHQSWCVGTGVARQMVRGFSTRIEDETATAIVPALQKDGFISQVEPTYNFGASPQLQLRTTSERRALLQFNLSALPLPVGGTVAAAYLEFWPSTAAGASVTLTAHPLRRSWAEGTTAGGPCVDGATWTTSNCTSSWTSGGDYDGGRTATISVDVNTTFASMDVTAFVNDWMVGGKTNYGFDLLATSSTANRSVTFAAREGETSATPSARLVVILAGANAYSALAVKSCLAEIVPTTVVNGVPNQRFVYSFRPSYGSSSTGMNRFSVTIPAPFAFVGLDTVAVGGQVLAANTDATLANGEYENWGTGSTLDIRFAPPHGATSPDPRIQIVFRASTPTTIDLTGKEFLSVVDHDRRGAPSQSTTKGNANGDNSDSNTWLVRTNIGILQRVDVLPTSASASLGDDVTYQAWARYSNGSSADVSAYSTWAVAPSTLGSFAPNSGVLHTLASGSGSVTATYGGSTSAPSALSVGPAVLRSAWITPASASMPAGGITAYRAFGAYSSHDTLEITSTALWSIDDLLVARLDAPGLVHGLRVGSTTLRASSGSIVATPAAVGVTPAELVSLAILPADTTVALGQSARLHARGTYSDSTRSDLSSIVTWQTSPAGIIDIDADGLATTLATGSTIVRAALGSVTSPAANFTVTPPVLVAIAVVPADTTVALGYTVSLRARGTYSDGSTATLTGVTWSASPSGIISIAPNGIASTLAQGTASVSATLNSMSSPPTNLTVGPAALVGIAVVPTDTTVALGYTAQLRARGTYSDGSTAMLSGVSWSASPAGVISIAADGTVSTLAQGTAAVRAAVGSVQSAGASFTVAPPQLIGVSVVPADTTVALGYPAQLRARGTYSDGSTATLSGVSWSATPIGIISIAPSGGVSTITQGTATVHCTFGPLQSAPGSFTVGPPELLAIAVTPSDTTVALGYSALMRARGTYSNGSTLTLSGVTWSAAPGGIINIAASGGVTTLAAGTATVRATLGAVTSPPATFNVAPAQLLGITVVPADTTVALGFTAQLHARGSYSDGSSATLSGVTWSATPAGIISIAADGTASTLAQGTATVRAALGATTSPPASFRVGPTQLVSIAVIPADTTVALGYTARLRAHGTYSNGSTATLSGVTWTAAPAGIISIDASGIATTLAPGTTAVRAALGAITSPSANFTVAPAQLLALDGTPDVAAISLGAQHSVHSIGTYSDGSTVDLTASVNWASLDPAIADFIAPGTVQSNATGTARLVHSLGSVRGDTLHVVVTSASLDSLGIGPNPARLPPGVTAAFTATAHFSDGSTLDVTQQATWSSDAVTVASITSPGRVATHAAGLARLVAQVSSVTSPACSLTVDPNALDALVVAPADTTVPVGAGVHYVARGTVGGATYDLTATVAWSTDDATVATVTSPGMVATHSTGNTQVRASSGTVQSTPSALHVTPPTLLSLRVAPADTVIALGLTATLRAYGTYSDGSTGLVAGVSWSATPAGIVTIDAAGVVTTVSPGSASVRATSGSVVSPVTSFTVTPAQLVAVVVQPADTTVALGRAVQLHAIGYFSDASTADYTDAVIWSATPGIVAIDLAGRATAIGQGSATIGAAYGAFTSAPAAFTVTAAELTAIRVLPADTTIALGESATLRARGTYSDGGVRDLAIATWSALPAGLVGIDSTGHLATLATGTATLHAAIGSVVSAPAACTVAPPRLVALDGAPDSTTVPAGVQQAVTSTGRYTDGSQRDETSHVLWSSLDPGIAAFVDPGLVAAKAPGLARLVHSLGGVVGDTLRLRVTVPALESLSVAPPTLRLPPGARATLVATGHYDNGSTSTLTSGVLWTTNDAAVATVDSLGQVATHTSGAATITASVGAIRAGCAIEVDVATLDSLVVSPADSTVRIGETIAYHAVGWAGTHEYDLTQSVAWSVADTVVARITASGSLTGRNIGTTTVQAALGTVSARPARLRIDSARLVGLEVVPASSTLRLGRTKAFVARALFSDGALLDVSRVVHWTSSVPSIAHIDTTGTATALGLGSTNIQADYGGFLSNIAVLTVLPAVQLEALATSSADVLPGDVDRPLLTLRLTNRYLDVRRLDALRFTIRGPATRVRLRLDDGDDVLEPARDSLLATSIPNLGSWTASGLGLDLPVGQPRTLFLSGDVDLHTAAFGDTLDAAVQGVGDVFWTTATAIVASFPLDGTGSLRVTGLVRGQIAFVPTCGDSLLAGTNDNPVFQLELPDDGGHTDALESIAVRELGTGAEGIDLQRLRLQAGPAPWTDVTTFAFTGGGQWTSSGLTLPIPAGGAWVRVVADLAPTARAGRTVRFELPASALAFRSGRIGPMDGAWADSAACVIQSPRTLLVAGVAVSHGGLVGRSVGEMPILGLSLTANVDVPDTLRALTLTDVLTGPDGTAPDPNIEIGAAAVWLDANANGSIDPGDTRLESLVPSSGSTLGFGSTHTLGVPLAPGSTLRLLITLTPNPATVRDGERFGLRLAQPQDVRTAAGSSVRLSGELETLDPPVIDGQEAAGYAVQAASARIVPVGAPETIVLSLALPANGFADDILQDLQVENSGTAVTSEAGTLRLRRDDGDGVLGATDSLVATLVPTGDRSWAVDGLTYRLSATDPRRFFVTLEVPASAQSGRTFEARVPLGGIHVASGNDGPTDSELDGGGAIVLTAPNQILWVAGVAGNHAVAPDTRRQPVLVLETLNSYSQSRTLTGLTVAMRGSAATSEFETWGLYADDNQNGMIDDNEAPLAVASLQDGSIRFESLAYTLASLRQQRLLVTYSLALRSARDGSSIDAAIANAAAFTYSTADGATATTAQFEMNSAGVDVVDGMVRRQVTSHPVVSQSLGGGENDVLALDFVVPPNGWEPDVLTGLEVAAVPLADVAAFGSDFEAIRLWAEVDADPVAASFDPNQDLLLATLLPGTTPWRFSGLSSPIPAAGRRVYVTIDIAPTPTDGRRLQLQVPIGGLELTSGNDGPIDAPVVSDATHQISSSQLLAAVSAQPLRTTQGQDVEVRIAVRNRGSAPLQNVIVQHLDVVPARPGSLTFGPSPASLTLAPGVIDTFRCRFRITTPGAVHFTALASLADSSISAAPATSPQVFVERTPTGIALVPLSNLPAIVNRGQHGLVPLLWQFTHRDTDSLAAAIAVRHLDVDILDGNGAPLAASAVFDHLEIRSGDIVRAALDPVPDSSRVHLRLDPPLVLRPGEQQALPLTASIAPAAAAASFRLRLALASAVDAVDVNAAVAVPVQASFPWTTPTVGIRTLAPRADLSVTRLLPATANRGQAGITAAQLVFALPGNPGESEARITQLALQFTTPNGTAIDPSTLLRRAQARSGSTLLLETTALAAADGNLQLPLTIPQAVASGAPAAIDLVFDLLDTPAVDSLRVGIRSAADILCLDAITAATLPLVLASPDSFPLAIGTCELQQRSDSPALTATARAPQSALAGTDGLPVAHLRLLHVGAASSASIDLRAVTCRVLDAAGQGVTPGSAIAAARLRAGAQILATNTSLPSTGATFTLTVDPPPRLHPGESLDLDLEIDLAATPAAPWLRFAFDPTALDVRDANEPDRVLGTTGTIPFATDLLRIVTAPTAVAMAITADPPANATRGAKAVRVLTLRATHPGTESQSSLQLQQVVIGVRDVDQSPLGAAQLAKAAWLVAGADRFAGVLAADSLRFDVRGLTPLSPGASVDLDLVLDLAGAPPVADVRFALDQAGTDARAGSQRLAVVSAAGGPFQYLSPSMHLSAPSLAASFANYPNPFAAGREATRIVFFLPGDARVTAEVYTMAGERVVRLLDAAPLAAGLHDELHWDGRNGRSEVVRNGTYMLRLLVDGPGGGRLLRKLAVLR